MAKVVLVVETGDNNYSSETLKEMINLEFSHPNGIWVKEAIDYPMEDFRSDYLDLLNDAETILSEEGCDFTQEQLVKIVQLAHSKIDYENHNNAIVESAMELYPKIYSGEEE